jgi:hypothetical protein
VLFGLGRAVPFLADDGLRFVRRVPILRAVLIQAPLVNFSFTGVIFTITPASGPWAIGAFAATMAIAAALCPILPGLRNVP